MFQTVAKFPTVAVSKFFQSLERIVTTFVHYLEWHTDDPKRMSRSLKKIHAIHTAVNENAAKRHGISIAKHDMMVAQVGGWNNLLYRRVHFWLLPFPKSSLAHLEKKTLLHTSI